MPRGKTNTNKSAGNILDMTRIHDAYLHGRLCKENTIAQLMDSLMNPGNQVLSEYQTKWLPESRSWLGYYSDGAKVRKKNRLWLI